MTNSIYLDNAASTPVDPQVVAKLVEMMATVWGNPSAAHPQGVAARQAIAAAREQLLAALGDPGGAHGDIVWTSGCTEANALAVLGAAAMGPGAVVISSIEHPAVAENARRLAGQREVLEVAPRRQGRLVPDDLAARARQAGARVVSFVAVQNEVGAVQPFAELAAAVKAAAPGCHVHLDAAQAMGKVALDVRALAVDSIALAAHKFHGPTGVGALWLRHGAALAPLWGGGGQQRGLRAGTQNAVGAAGMGVAAALAAARREQDVARWREYAGCVRGVLAARGVEVGWQLEEPWRAPHILALAFARVTAEAVRNTLTSRGVLVSTGSACASGKGAGVVGGGKGSAGLAAMGIGEEMAMVRMSFGHQTQRAEVERAAEELAVVVKELRGRG